MNIFIYSRKSKWTGRGESVENQIAMCKDYIQYQIEGAKKAQIQVFEDEGYSGKNTNRPMFQKMMQEIEQGHCSFLVCYKLDRLGRNIADLANLIETLNKLDVSFVSIKERFDTSTPIGKAMLYFAGVLAQMEREQIAERVRDNMIMLARKGRWLGGNTPLGFFAEAEEKIVINGRNKKSFCLAIDEENMKTVRFIFQEYLKNPSLIGIVRYFLNHNIRTKRGNEYTTTAIRDILTNPVYCKADLQAYQYFWDLGCQVCMDQEEADGKYGLIAYAKTTSSQYKNQENALEKWIVAKGKHPGIVSGKEFVKVQKLLAKNSSKGESWHTSKNQTALLSGLLYCSCGHRMRPKYYSSQQVTKQGERKFSYLCPYKDMTHGEKCAVPNIQGNALDELVCSEVLRYTQEHTNLKELLHRAMEQAEHRERECVTSAEILTQEIRKRKKEVENLISVLAKSGGDNKFIQQVEQQIVKLNAECSSLEKEEIKMRVEKKNVQENNVQTVVLLAQFSSFNNLFQSLSVFEKREFLGLILNRVVWDGEEANIFM